MPDVIKGKFAKDGIEIGDRRALALSDWLSNLGRPATAAEISAEMERLRKIMPAPEDDE